MHRILDLDEVLGLICPFPDGKEAKKRRPKPEMRASFFGDEPGRFDSTPLTLSLKRGEEEIQIKGTADGIYPDSPPRPMTVEEELLLDRMTESVIHRERSLLRAKLLALALIHTKKLEQVKIRLSVFAEGRMEMEEFLFVKDALSADVAPFIRKLLSVASLWRAPDFNIRFPYKSLRDGQKGLIHAAWDAIKSGSKLYACAPTGIGKTLAVLYPALRALETGRKKKVYYVSPKNTLKMQAAAAVESLQEVCGLRTLVLSAKMSLCPEQREECRREECPFAEMRGEVLAEALAFLSEFSCVTAKELQAAGQQFGLCPFELALKMKDYCQVIIGDYNHVFDPARAVLPPSADALLLVDEAHNLPARVRESFTETLAPADLDFFFRDPSPSSAMLREHFAPLTAVFAHIEKKRNESKEYFSFEKHEGAEEAVNSLLPKVGFALHGGFGVPSEETETQLRNLYRKLKKYSGLCRIFNENFATVYPPEGGVRIYLVNPRERIENGAKGFGSALFFSATLQPKEYYFQILAGEEGDEFLELSSPFPEENLFVGICPVDVSYSQRYVTAPKICSIIRAAVSVKEGNYMVFLPSFEYMSLVVQEFKRNSFHHKILVQERIMTAKKRRDFLAAFENNRKGTLIGFCVMGGIFSEGIDLKGDSLSGEIIVGTGFPPPSPEAEAECASYYKRELDGKSFAYTLPGWSRVLQAAGRVIRSEEDRGFLILCDARYQGEDMKELFPSHWDNAVLLERESALKQELTTFWK